MPRLGLGLGLTMGNILGVGLSAEALAWEARIVTNGGTILPATLQIFDTHFFKPAIANGNILTELDRLNIYCGLNGYEIAARTNIIKSAHFVTPVSSPTFDNNGYKSAGTGYLDLNYNPNTQGVKLTLNSVSLGYVVKTPLFAATKRGIGCSNASTARLELIRDSSGSAVFCNSLGFFNTNKTSIGNVFLLGRRTLSNSQEAIINATVTSDVSASVSIPNFNAWELTVNSAGTPAGNYDDFYHLTSFHGSKNLDYTNLRIILNNLYAALGV